MRQLASPATAFLEGLPPSTVFQAFDPPVPASPITYVPSSAATATAPPLDGAEIDGVLSRAHALARNGDLPPDAYRALACYLGAAHRVWTAPRRQALREVLELGGLLAAGATLRAIADTPRVEVVDAGIAVLSRIAFRDPRLLSVAAIAAGTSIRDRHPSIAHAACRRALLVTMARSTAPSDAKQRALVAALRDEDVEVRDTAIAELARCADYDIDVAAVLRAHRAVEADPFLVEQIDEVLAELSPTRD